MSIGELKHQELPLARIKKIMKLDEDVKVGSPRLIAGVFQKLLTGGASVDVLEASNKYMNRQIRNTNIVYGNYETYYT